VDLFDLLFERKYILNGYTRRNRINGVALLLGRQDSHLLLAGNISQAELQVKQVHISEELKHYIVEIVKATRSAAGVVLGASPRASISLMQIAKALALFDGQTFVSPDNIQEIASAVMAHRIVMDPQARFSGQTADGIVEDILTKVPVPA